MGTTKIQWATRVHNVVTGCSPCSVGCSGCYAQRMSERLRGRAGYDSVDPFKPTFHPDHLRDPLHWKDGQRIFVSSMGDLFHEQVPFEWVDEVFKVICECHGRHVFLILTKRPRRMIDWFEHARKEHVGWFSPSTGLLDLWQTWFGVSVENQANESRINHLLLAPTDRTFVSCEPLLGPLDLTTWMPNFLTYVPEEQRRLGLKLVITGGETGPRARPPMARWVRDLQHQSVIGGAAFYLKSWGRWLPAELVKPEDWPTKSSTYRLAGDCSTKEIGHWYDVGPKYSGNLLDGVSHQELPLGMR